MIRPWMAFSHCGLPPGTQVGIRAQEDKGRPDRAEQGDADQRAGQGAAAARNRHAAHHHGRDDLELQARARVGVDVGEPDGVQQVRPGRPAPPSSRRRRRPRAAAGCPPAGPPRGRSPSRRRTGPPPGCRSPQAKTAKTTSAIATTSHWPAVWPSAEPLKARRQVADELALAHVTQRLAPDHQRGQRDHDRGQAQPGDQHAVDRAQAATGQRASPARPAPIGRPGLRQQPGDHAADAEDASRSRCRSAGRG